jgi:hypothetical protein
MPNELAKRAIAVAVVLLFTACGAAPQTSENASLQAWEWPQSTLADLGANARPIDALIARVRAGAFGNVDRMVVILDGQLVVNETFDRDYHELSRGRTGVLGCGADACTDDAQLHAYNYLHPDFHPWWQGRNVHTLQSVTKAIAATVIGAAIERGDIDGVAAPLLSFFSAYDTSQLEPRLARATLQDVLTMRSGIEWHETDRPLDETNTTLQLERSDDWIRFTLAQPMDAEPGEKWVYNSGGSQLISEIIRSASGEHIDRYAERHLFGPLGIREHHWKHTPTGHPDTEGGLFLEAGDLARIGQLYLDDGVWKGQRILPAGWAREATSRHVDRVADSDTAPGYGYQWWVHEHRGFEIWTGRGFGGQLLAVIPDARIVGVINSWNVFGDNVPGMLGPFLDALIDSAP